MKGFKIIGIKILQGCKSKIRRSLDENELYQFYYDYTFHFEENDITKKVTDITTNQTLPENLFSSKKTINVSAIVGKNGSGKSTLLEIIYASSFLLGEKYGKIEDLHWLDKSKNPYQLTSDRLMDISQELVDLKEDALFEIYFAIDKDIYRVINNGNDQIYIEQKSIEHERTKWKKNDNEKLSHFFYSIAINYSLHGLNEKYGGNWLSSLFHKNDGYQTPLVINPYRYDGTINIDNEYHLAQSRILSNLQFSNNYELLEDRNLEGLNFLFDPRKTLTLRSISFSLIAEGFEKIENRSIVNFFEKVYKEFFSEDFQFAYTTKEELRNEIFNKDDTRYTLDKNSQFRIVSYSELEVHLIKYVIYKVLKLCAVDEEYRNEFSTEVVIGGHSIFSIKNETELVKKVCASSSHLTLKIRQILFCIKSEFFNLNKIQRVQNPYDTKVFQYKISFEINDYKSHSATVVKKIDALKKDSLDVVPAAFANIELFLNNYKSTEGDSAFHTLSSGEQQMLLTLQTIYYHLYNLNSVEESDQKAKYSNVNIILDEVELSFHPEYQRKFIYQLIRGLETLVLKQIYSINILFSTHSPFILSDIPNRNILRMENGKPSKKEFSQTFGANIHELIADSFFMRSTMGSFVETKIKEISDFYYRVKETFENEQLDNLRKEYTKKSDNFNYIVQNIGEDVFRKILENHLSFIEMKLGMSLDEIRHRKINSIL